MQKLLWMIFIVTFVFPFISTIVLFYVIHRSVSVGNMFMEDRKERFYPFLFTGFFYAAIAYMFLQSGLHANVVVIMGGIALSVILVAIITHFWKISAHAVGICGVLGYVLIIAVYYPYELMLYPIIGVAFLAGLLLSARLNLNAHTPAQVFAGALLGLVTSASSYYLFQQFGFNLVK